MVVDADLKRKVIDKAGCNWETANDLVEEAQALLGFQHIDSNNEDAIVNKAAEIYKDVSTFHQRKPSQHTATTDQEQPNNRKPGTIQAGSLCPKCCVIS